MDTEAALMLFSVSEFLFALEIGNLVEVTLINPEDLLQDTDGQFESLLNYRGSRIPVVRLIGDIKTCKQDQLQVLIAYRVRPFAILIDKVKEIVSGHGTVYRLPEMLRTSKNRFIKAVFRFNNKIAFEIDPSLLINTNEIAALKAL